MLPIVGRSLWWTCPKPKNLWKMVVMLQERWFGYKECSGQPHKFEDVDLRALFDEGSTQTLEQLTKSLNVVLSTISERRHALGKIQKEELRRKIFKGENPLVKFCFSNRREKVFCIKSWQARRSKVDLKHRKSWADPSHQPSKSQSVRNIHGKIAWLCIWWDSGGAVYYKLLKSGETISGNRYR